VPDGGQRRRPQVGRQVEVVEQGELDAPGQQPLAQMSPAALLDVEGQAGVCVPQGAEQLRHQGGRERGVAADRQGPHHLLALGPRRGGHLVGLDQQRARPGEERATGGREHQPARPLAHHETGAELALEFVDRLRDARCETWQAWAALVIEPASAAATKYSSCRSVKEAPAMILTVVSVARRS